MVRSLRLPGFTAVLVVLLAAAPVSRAQFNAVSSFPADGQAGVPLGTTLSVDFSSPVDTSVVFEDSAFFLNIDVFPEIRQSASIGLTQDGLTFIAEVTLEPDTKYVVLLTGARSTSGDPLSRPFVVTFTTGSILPSGSVSGTVTGAAAKNTGGAAKNKGVPAKKTEGTAVAIFPDDPRGGLFGAGDGDPVGATVVDPDGSYTIRHVEDGSYVAVAVQDLNQDGSLDFELGDAFGLYDADGDGLTDAFPLESGGAVGEIDIGVSIPEPVTARENAAAAQALAEDFHADAVLTSVSADLDPSGRSALWIYLFHSRSAASHLALVNVGGQFAPSAFVDDGRGFYDITAPLSEGWLDSDVIARIANENGGSEFAASWENVEGFGSAAGFAGSFGKRSTGAPPVRFPGGGFGDWRPAKLSSAGRFRKASSSVTPTPIWFVGYFGSNAGGSNGFLDLVIHGVTGEIDPPLESYTSAHENLDAANALALSWSPDAGLVQVVSGVAGVHRAGVSSDWRYTYYSETLTKTESAAARTFVIQEGQVVDQLDVAAGTLFSTEVLPDNWSDSPGITSVADAGSDDFRGMNADAYVRATLSKGLIPWDLSRPVWRYEYISSSDSRSVQVNALAGTLIVRTEDDEVPSTLMLDQNYPNPFNPATTIAYEVPFAGGVTIRIFDALGRQIRVLVDRSHTPGRYSVEWEGRDDSGAFLSSGIYIYKLEAGRESETRSMILLR